MVDHSTASTKKERIVEKNGVRFECKRFVRYTTRGNYKFWRCGACRRGKFKIWDSECAVCHAKVVPQ